jgi:hypothetical protein
MIVAVGGVVLVALISAPAKMIAEVEQGIQAWIVRRTPPGLHLHDLPSKSHAGASVRSTL